MTLDGSTGTGAGTPAGYGSRRVPVPALVLGLAGLLPPLLAIFARLSAGSGVPLARFAMLLGLGYVALILSFLGGLWWGLAASRLPAERIGRWLGLSVVPTLVAFLIQIVSGWYPHLATILLAVALVATLVVDRRLVIDGLAPRWWMRLRLPLSAGLAAMTLMLAALL
jgi:hypothetical protein